MVPRSRTCPCSSVVHHRILKHPLTVQSVKMQKRLHRPGRIGFAAPPVGGGVTKAIPSPSGEMVPVHPLGIDLIFRAVHVLRIDRCTS